MDLVLLLAYFIIFYCYLKAQGAAKAYKEKYRSETKAAAIYIALYKKYFDKYIELKCKQDVVDSDNQELICKALKCYMKESRQWGFRLQGIAEGA